MPVDQPASASRALAGVGLLVVVVLGLHQLGHPGLAPPDLTSPTTWADWATSRSPILAAMSLVRLLAIALAWYLLVITVLQLLVAATDSDALASSLHVVSTSTSRHLATAVLGAGVLATTPVLSTAGSAPLAIAGASPAQPSPSSLTATPSPTPTMDPPTLRRGAQQQTASTTDDVVADGADLPRLDRVDSPRLTRLEPDDTPTVGDEHQDRPDGATDPADDRADDHDSANEQGTPAAETWTVVGGDHFWKVAEQQVARQLDRNPTEPEIASWWRDLVAVNADRLVDAGNPDLILPGQVMRFPDSSVREAG